MMLQRGGIQLIAVAFALLAGRAGPLAQAPPVAAAVRADTTGAVALDVSGLWEGTFTLDSALRLPARATSRSIVARIQFSPVGDATPASSSGRTVHPGTFVIDFSRFGFTLATQEALGWSTNPDSLRAVLNPTVDHGFVELHGRIEGDSAAVGTWRYTSDPGHARGTFRLQRARQ